MQVAEPKIHRWTFDRYMRSAEAGTFDHDHVELIDGEIVDMAPQNDPHAIAVTKTVKVLLRIFDENYWVKVQATLRLNEQSAPEPDFAVLPGPAAVIPNRGRPLLIVEVSDMSLLYDRTVKASLYAASGVADYWIVNLVERRLEVHRDAVADPAARFGWRYESVASLDEQQRIAPLAAGDQFIEVGMLLP